MAQSFSTDPKELVSANTRDCSFELSDLLLYLSFLSAAISITVLSLIPMSLTPGFFDTVLDAIDASQIVWTFLLFLT